MSGASPKARQSPARPSEEKVDRRELADDIKFSINQLNGKEMTVIMAPTQRLCDLKQEVADHWKIPKDCQRFNLENEPLAMKDPDRLSTIWTLVPSKVDSKSEDGAQSCEAIICLTVIVNTESLVGRLEAVTAGQRSSALNDIGMLGQRLPRALVEQVRRIFNDDRDNRVRTAAADALPEIVSEDDEEKEKVLETLIERFEDVDSNDDLLKHIAKALAKLAVGCHRDRVFEAVKRKLDSEDSSSRRIGLTALSLLAIKTPKSGDRQAIEAARKCLNDEEASVRRLAVNTLCEVSARGDELAIKEVCDCWERESNSFVRTAVLTVLPNMLESDDTRPEARPEATRAQELLKEHTSPPRSGKRGIRDRRENRSATGLTPAEGRASGRAEEGDSPADDDDEPRPQRSATWNGERTPSLPSDSKAPGFTPDVSGPLETIRSVSQDVSSPSPRKQLNFAPEAAAAAAPRPAQASDTHDSWSKMLGRIAHCCQPQR